MKSRPIRLLLVEDNPQDARLLRELLGSETSAGVEITHVERMSDVAAQVAAGATDVILLDLGLPDAHGPGAVRQAHALAPTVALVVLTGFDDESLANQVLKEGAQDYLMKGQLDGAALVRALRHAVQRQRMQVETDLIRTLQLQLRDEFLSDVSHELRSPLTAIYQFSTIMADGLSGPTTPEQQEQLEIILRNVQQLRAMIDDLLEAGRAEGGTLTIAPECTSLADVIAYTVTTLHGLAREKGITLSFDLPPDLPSAYADPTRLRQILIILLDNAIKFTPPNGVVMIHARVDGAEPNSLLVEVSDSGCGVSPELTEKIFDRLYTVAGTSQDGRRGLGLGLFICKELVTRQGGRIWVTSEPQRGSVFSFALPKFSLPRLIAPMLEDKGNGQAAMALVAVCIARPPGEVVDDSWQHWSRETRRAVQACLSPDVELLLPEMGSSRRDQCAFVLTAAGDAEVAALSTRIRKECDGLDPLRKAGISYSVSSSVLEQPPTANGASIEERIETMSSRITERITQARADHHE
jgi:signal transduction histidine kinase